jgi:hypothetical protein
MTHTLRAGLRFLTVAAVLISTLPPGVRAAEAAAATRPCSLIATGYGAQGDTGFTQEEALEKDARATLAVMLQKWQGQRLVAMGYFVDSKKQENAERKSSTMLALTKCDTLIEIKEVLLGRRVGGAFGFDIAVRRVTAPGQPYATVFERQYRYLTDTATLDAFSKQAFAMNAWDDLRASRVLDGDIAATPIDEASVHALYDKVFPGGAPAPRRYEDMRDFLAGNMLWNRVVPLADTDRAMAAARGPASTQP